MLSHDCKPKSGQSVYFKYQLLSSIVHVCNFTLFSSTKWHISWLGLGFRMINCACSLHSIPWASMQTFIYWLSFGGFLRHTWGWKVRGLCMWTMLPYCSVCTLFRTVQSSTSCPPPRILPSPSLSEGFVPCYSRSNSAQSKSWFLVRELTWFSKSKC